MVFVVGAVCSEVAAGVCFLKWETAAVKSAQNPP